MTEQTPSQPSEMPAPAGASASPGEETEAVAADPVTIDEPAASEPAAAVPAEPVTPASDPVTAPQTAAAQAGLAGSSAGSWSAAPSEPIATPPAAGTEDHPEIPVGAAFAGGFVIAMILKRLAR